LAAAGFGAVVDGVLDAGQVQCDAELSFTEAWRDGGKGQKGGGPGFR
jgi:hypothetical protein